MSSERPEIALAHGASLRLRLPEGAVAEPSTALPPVDVSGVPGGAIVARAGFRSEAVTLRVVCATAPSRGWAPGVEGLVLGRVSQIARGVLGGEVVRFEAADVAAIETRFEQRFDASVRREGGITAAHGRHVLGFAGEARDAIVCSLVCAEPVDSARARPMGRVAKEGGARCAGLVEGASAEGAWVAAPPPSLWVRGILLAAEQPAAALAIAGAATFALAALVIARRPRPSARRRSSPARAAPRGRPSSPARTSGRT